MIWKYKLKCTIYLLIGVFMYFYNFSWLIMMSCLEFIMEIEANVYNNLDIVSDLNQWSEIHCCMFLWFKWKSLLFFFYVLILYILMNKTSLKRFFFCLFLNVVIFFKSLSRSLVFSRLRLLFLLQRIINWKIILSLYIITS